MCSLSNIRGNDIRNSGSSQKQTLNISAEQRAALHAMVDRFREKFRQMSIIQSGQEQEPQASQDSLRVSDNDNPGSDDRKGLVDMRGSAEQTNDSRDIVDCLRRGRGIRAKETVERNDDNRSEQVF